MTAARAERRSACGRPRRRLTPRSKRTEREKPVGSVALARRRLGRGALESESRAAIERVQTQVRAAKGGHRHARREGHESVSPDARSAGFETREARRVV